MRLIGIALRSSKMAPLVEVEEAKITFEDGLVGDSRSKSSKEKRRITILSQEQWEDACREVGAQLPWYTRRANLCVTGIRFGSHHIGQVMYLYMGNVAEVVLEVTGETTPCQRMDEAFPGLQQALARDGRGGITCKLLRHGSIRRDTKVYFDGLSSANDDQGVIF